MVLLEKIIWSLYAEYVYGKHCRTLIAPSDPSKSSYSYGNGGEWFYIPCIPF
jgi:hypothetical protein